jgi:hypothetical protein
MSFAMVTAYAEIVVLNVKKERLANDLYFYLRPRRVRCHDYLSRS